MCIENQPFQDQLPFRTIQKMPHALKHKHFRTIKDNTPYSELWIVKQINHFKTLIYS